MKYAFCLGVLASLLFALTPGRGADTLEFGNLSVRGNAHLNAVYLGAFTSVDNNFSFQETQATPPFLTSITLPAEVRDIASSTTPVTLTYNGDGSIPTIIFSIVQPDIYDQPHPILFTNSAQSIVSIKFTGDGANGVRFNGGISDTSSPDYIVKWTMSGLIAFGGAPDGGDSFIATSSERITNTGPSAIDPEGEGDSIVITYKLASVPEPANWGMPLAVGLLAVVIFRRRSGPCKNGDRHEWH